MKKYLLITLMFAFFVFTAENCSEDHPKNTSALDEQARTENNQRGLNEVQPPPHLTWSLERDNLIKRFKLQNDRSVMFFMYVFIEGVADPVGYYQVNKVSSVNSQLTNTMQIISGVHSGNDIPSGQIAIVPSPAEDGSYGENGAGIFGFTPEDIYIETNMKYITATVPLNFAHPVVRLAIINTDEARQLLEKSKKAMK